MNRLWRLLPGDWPLHGRLTACVATGAAVAFALFVVVAALALQHTERGLAVERMRIVATGIATAIESRVDLGLPLDFLEDAQRLIEREKVATPGISRIDLFGPRGMTLYSTERAAIGEPVDPSWMSGPSQPASKPWVTRRSQDFEVGVPIMNSFNRAIGGVAVVVTSSGVVDGMGAILLAVAVPGLLLLILGLLAALWAARLFLGDWERRIDGSVRRLAAPLGADPAAGPGERSAVDMAGHRLRVVLSEMDAAERRIRQIDESA